LYVATLPAYFPFTILTLWPVRSLLSCIAEFGWFASVCFVGVRLLGLFLVLLRDM
jgi:hypothetical protein